MVELRHRSGTAARALEFLVLTASRSGETRGACWSEFDLDAGIWTIPASRMKANVEHRVPLSDPALRLLRALPSIDGTDLVFPGSTGRTDNKPKPLSDMTLLAIMRRMNAQAVPHGFRSTFRDWASERTNYPRDVAEMALAHAIENKVEAAYRRGDMFDKRAKMMAAWATFCAKRPAALASVTAIHRRASA